MPSRRALLAALGGSGLAAAGAGASGARAAASGTAAGDATDRARSRARRAADTDFVTDFEHPASRLDDRGWTVQYGGFRTADSYLLAADDGENLDYQLSRPQQRASGSWWFHGVRNEAAFYELEFAFLSDSPTYGRGKAGDGGWRGYQLAVRNEAKAGSVELQRVDGDGSETLVVLTDDHGGRELDVEIERDPDGWEFRCYLDGEQVGSAVDDTYTDSAHWVQKHGAGDTQRVDRVGVGPVQQEWTSGGYRVPGFATDFEYATDRLDDRGWTVRRGRFETTGSDLVAPGAGPGNTAVVTRPQPWAAGTFRFRGVRNAATFSRLRMQFVADRPTYADARGYQMVWVHDRDGEARHGNVELVRTDADGAETLVVLTDDHGGERTDVHVERDADSWEFRCYLDGEFVGSAVDDTYTDSAHWVQRHDDDAQRVDALAVNRELSGGAGTATSAADGDGLTTAAEDDRTADGRGRTTTVRTGEGDASPATAWLDGWRGVLAGLLGVPVAGAGTLGGLLALSEWYRGGGEDADGQHGDGGE